MPTDKRPLSERLKASADLHHEYIAVACERGDAELTDEELEIITELEELAREAARLVAPFEQPEVADLLAEAEACEGSNSESPHWECAKGRAEDLRAHAHALVALAEAQAKLKRVEGDSVPQEWTIVTAVKLIGKGHHLIATSWPRDDEHERLRCDWREYIGFYRDGGHSCHA